ncbi:ATP-binding protein [Treponema pectinovorum]|uniref:ATP-binding protein n=1 Tax=Treponema pectinovorum TaxID=164 RepID=UPI002090E251|nr:ATP-binding protein [Treponema pectinovorum]
MKKFTLMDIDTSFACYNQFVNLYAQLKDIMFDSIKIDLQEWFGANMSAVLGGLLDKGSVTNSVSISSNKSQIITILKKNKFLANYDYPIIPDTNGTTIKYLKLLPSESRYFDLYVMNELLSQSALPKMTDGLKKKIAESIYEIFVNAQTHSQTDYIYTCGQFFPHKNKIEFTIVDMGLGFKNIINNRIKDIKDIHIPFSSVQAIEWALEDGNTTKVNEPGGLGLSLLTEFIRLNQGKFQIISDDGFYEFCATKQTSKKLDAPFPGAIINMEFRTDDVHSYRLSSEVYNKNEIF